MTGIIVRRPSDVRFPDKCESSPKRSSQRVVGQLDFWTGLRTDGSLETHHGATQVHSKIMSLVGYAQVSTTEQNLALQRDALNAAGAC